MKAHESLAIKATYFSIVSSLILAVVKWLAGYYGNSYALIADAIESTSDIFSSVILCLGLHYSARPVNPKYPYGYGKLEPLIAFLSVGFLFSSAMIIAYTSVVNIYTPHELPKPFTLYVLAVIIVWKELSFQFIHHKAVKTHSSSLKADAWHHRSDAITSVAAFIGISVALILGPGHENADDWAALFAAGIILYNAYQIFRPALGEILDQNTYDEISASIKHIAEHFPGVKNTEKCHVRKSGMKYYVDFHVRVDGDISVKEGHAIAHDLKDALKAEIPHLGDVLIHIEPT